jgi:maltooligosyltrehalose trehalohydrolase
VSRQQHRDDRGRGGAVPQRRLPVGAEPVPGGGVHFRVWAPLRTRVDVVLEGEAGGGATGATGRGGAGGATGHGGATAAVTGRNRAVPLRAEGDGWFSAVVDDAGTGWLYRFLLDGDGPYPDPASRFQPDGPHGPSQVVDPGAFTWSDSGWQGVAPVDRVIYELHIGTFTAEGTWAAATRELPELAALGVTVLEVMPVADFPGRFGWGYDGVNLFATTRLYGAPDDFRHFVDAAHAAGLAVILDVVYNHLGPDGNFLGAFSHSYFTERYETDWGLPFNVDGPDSGPVREYILGNVEMWIREYHLDGLRLDATQAIFDAAEQGPHIIAEIARTARQAAGGRAIFLLGENEPQQSVHLLPGEQGGYGLDALWNDDWHHSAIVALTGRNEAYYSDYLGVPQEFVSLTKHGFLYQGQNYQWQKQRRGTPVWGLPADSFVNFLQNHDQVANSARGDRIHRLTSPGQLRAVTALLLLGPGTPMLFQGQEFAASAPFLYFADHQDDLAEAVYRGRRKFLEQFPSLALPRVQEEIDDPADPATFLRCKLDLSQRAEHGQLYAMHRDLLHLRREEQPERAARAGIDGAVLGGEALVLRFFGGSAEGGDDRLLLVNLGRELRFSPAPQPLLAPPTGHHWRARWSSEDVKYGGLGHPDPEDADGRWSVPGQATVLLVPQRVGRGSTTVGIEEPGTAT